MCYTYDELSRVTTRVIRKTSDNLIVSAEAFSYDAAGNVTDAPDSCFAYDTNNRLISFNGNEVSYDLDGNMLSSSSLTCTYDSANRLVSAGGHTYTYNAEDVRIRNLCSDADTTYVYDTNAKLSKLLCKTTNGITTKYVYGRGLIGEEKCGEFKTYHFDSRGSTVAITDTIGNITDTFAYDTYGKLISRTGSSFVIFGYNGRDGVVTDKNGLIYMRARYYSPDMKRFVNADIVAGEISNAVTLNRFAYANGNPVSLIDPFGLAPQSQLAYTTMVDETQKHSVYAGEMNDPGMLITYEKHSVSDVLDCCYDTIVDVSSAVLDWFEEAGEWLNKNARNKDGSYALYDNQRFDKNAVFHEQILAVTPSGPSFDLTTGNIGLGSLEVDALTGGWEGEQANLSLFDFGHAEAGAEIKNGDVKFGALASIWSPSFSFSIGKLSIDIGAEVGAVGAGFKKVNNGFSLFGAYGFGGSLAFSWND